ncbi:NAD(P)-dependent alcohol dehydrogenase [Gluconacetobacter entanii]|uniref:zinc-dependent alcohol dehydrogenase family protein n=1 Tax=Gluconacetobacter entanii TaxID=108528 RepID=UPI001C932276|nr:NAD(P)-dependent alcohol dehydrogenase [Gluconacetobacter entanii]MBY4640132.1 NAD(P)-dependent alcohol dehydrogenase [Gluconacetobacter entanii]MCW4580480.1 NAD(P)-dependent alcohol dehydrogenase [Gluconacetobacter entanii]MCW4583786.1 NAD(P)-dependent alcohol dehydrogenase [Gluconacetobacter entanii]MCW4587155.1 NAD(P)-dependent alcohol dehydrogenase [Gluconacetobacter entanii]
MVRTIVVQPPGGFENVTITEQAARAPAQGEIRVKLHASSLNYHDYAVVSGMWGPTVPRIPMADGAGEVIEVGAGVTEFAPGDRVVSTFFPTWLAGAPQGIGFATVPGDGIDGYAREEVTAPATSFTHAPQGWTYAEAATLTTAGLTAWRSLFVDDRIRPGTTVLVQGTGGVSIFALQFAKMAGATVIATSSSDEKLERLRDLGADHVINYRHDPAWGRTAWEQTGGKGVDHIVEVGGPGTLEQSMEAIRVGGHISTIGILSGVSGQLEIVPMLLKQFRLQGVLVGCRADQQAMIKAFDSHSIRPIIDRTFPLENILEAFKYQESNRHFGKICLDCQK